MWLWGVIKRFPLAWKLDKTFCVHAGKLCVLMQGHVHRGLCKTCIQPRADRGWLLKMLAATDRRVTFAALDHDRNKEKSRVSLRGDTSAGPLNFYTIIPGAAIADTESRPDSLLVTLIFDSRYRDLCISITPIWRFP